jgi:ketosteroid isomerase-like protein
MRASGPGRDRRHDEHRLITEELRMYAGAVRFMIRRGLRALNAGDIRPALSSYAKDAVLTFPGRSSWGREYRGLDEIDAFLQRCVDIGLQIEPDQIIVKGWPWRTTVIMRGRDSVTDPDGTAIYDNRLVIVAESAWGKVRRQEDYLDTQRVADLDATLADRQPADLVDSAHEGPR